MSKNQCHYCLKSEHPISINGQYRLKNGKLLCYRICEVCAKKLVSINTFKDKGAREPFLKKVRKNAKKDPEYN